MRMRLVASRRLMCLVVVVVGCHKTDDANNSSTPATQQTPRIERPAQADTRKADTRKANTRKANTEKPDSHPSLNVRNIPDKDRAPSLPDGSVGTPNQFPPPNTNPPNTNPPNTNPTNTNPTNTDKSSSHRQPAAANKGEPANKGPDKKGPDTVTVIISGRLNAEAEDSLANALLDAVDDPDQGLMTPVIVRGDTSRTTISPVRDVAAFARRIRVGTILRIDRVTRTLSISLPE